MPIAVNWFESAWSQPWNAYAHWKQRPITLKLSTTFSTATFCPQSSCWIHICCDHTKMYSKDSVPASVSDTYLSFHTFSLCRGRKTLFHTKENEPKGQNRAQILGFVLLCKFPIAAVRIWTLHPENVRSLGELQNDPAEARRKSIYCIHLRGNAKDILRPMQ